MRRRAFENWIVSRLRAAGLGEQAVKAAFAGGLAWALGGLVPGAPPQPYLAPLTAVLTIQLTIAESVTAAIHRTIGATVGVIVAVVAGTTFGVNPLTIAALVLVAQGIAAALRLNVIGTSQVVVTALLVLTIGGTSGGGGGLAYGWARVAETIVGAIVGVGINALLAPPTHLPGAQTAVTTLVTALQDELEAVAANLDAGLTQDVAAARLDQARQVTRHTPPQLGGPLADLVRAAHGVLAAFGASAHAPEARSEFDVCRQQLVDGAEARVSLLLPDGWEKLGAILATLDRLVGDLSGDDNLSD